MKSEQDYLYRALRKEEIEAGCVLIPKQQRAFQDWPMLGLDTTLPFYLGPAEKYAINHHQRGQETRGISTTPIFERAKYYASKNKTIVKISRRKLKKNNIKEIIVEESGSFKIVPEDHEVILIKLDDEPWSVDIIEEVIRIE
jgi:hypothetical protein